MTDVAFITAYSWRDKDMQVQALPFPIYEEHEISALFRPTTRGEKLTIHVLSFGCIADNEKDLRAFAKLCKVRKADVVSHEEKIAWCYNRVSITALVEWWRKARRNGAAKAGGDARSKNAERDFWERFSKIASRWHLKETSKLLMKEAGIKHHDTFRANLGYTRWEWRKLSDAKRSRVLKGKLA